MIQNGTDILLLLNGERIAAVKTNGIKTNAAMRDVSTKDSGGWKEQDYGQLSFSCSAEGLVRKNPKNLLNNSENLSAWVLDTSVAITPNNDVGNDGRKTADLITFHSGLFVQQLVSNLVNGREYTFSVWAKGTGDIDLVLDDGGGSPVSTSITLTPTLTRYSITATILSPGATALTASISKSTATLLNAWGAQLEQAATETDYYPSGKNFDIIMAAPMNKTVFTAVYTSYFPTETKFTGQVIISSIDSKAPNEESVTFTCSLEGTASLTQQTI
jgi:predicted secreted protein